MACRYRTAPIHAAALRRDAMNPDLTAKPRVIPIENLSELGPVGVLKPIVQPAAAAISTGLSHAGDLRRQSLGNMRTAAQSRPAPPVPCCSTRAARRTVCRGSNRRWMKIQWEVNPPQEAAGTTYAAGARVPSNGIKSKVRATIEHPFAQLKGLPWGSWCAPSGYPDQGKIGLANMKAGGMAH